jgi:hypothetical protein
VLLALVDGVGFRGNTAGLEGVLTKADEFCQFRTLWKAVVIASSLLGRPLRLVLPRGARARHEEFLARYGYTDRTEEADEPPADGVPAGEATILLA